MGVCYMKKGDNFLKVISFRVLSGIRTHDIQNHKLIKGLLNVLTFMCFPLCVVIDGKYLENMLGYVLGFMR